jgi:o-succinylbenzoate synthase
MEFTINAVRLHHISMPLVHFFETSFGRTYTRDMILVEVRIRRVSGWGEVTCGEHPFYNEEWTEGAWLLLRDYHCARRHRAPLRRTRRCRGAAAERARPQHGEGRPRGRLLGPGRAARGRALWKTIGGGARREIPCGVSIGIQDSVPQLLEKSARTRSRLPAHQDQNQARLGRGRNSAKSAANFPVSCSWATPTPPTRSPTSSTSASLDEFNLMMLEQPLAHDEIIDHAQLQAALKTPICLDECIRSAHHAEQACAWTPAASSTSSSAASAASVKRSGSTTSASSAASPSGAAACSKRASAAPTTSPWPRCPTSLCPAMSQPHGATGSATSSTRG